MATAFAQEAIRIHELVGLSHSEIGRAVGAAPSTVRDWFRGRTSPTGQRRERVAGLGEVVDRLARIMDPGYIAVWLEKLPLDVEPSTIALEEATLDRRCSVAGLLTGEVS